jgi:hypothetical protein
MRYSNNISSPKGFVPSAENEKAQQPERPEMKAKHQLKAQPQRLASSTAQIPAPALMQRRSLLAVSASAAYLAAYGGGSGGADTATPTATSAATPVPGPAPQPATGSKALLTEADLSFAGCFRLPVGLDDSRLQYFSDPELNRRNTDLANGLGMALRRINGQVRLYVGTVEGGVVEVAVPSSLARLPSETLTARVEQIWGNVYGGPRPLDNASNGDPRADAAVWGLYWDEPDQLLYWSYGEGYNTSSGNDPSVGASRGGSLPLDSGEPRYIARNKPA